MAGKGRNSELTVNFLRNFSRLKEYMDGSDPLTLGLAASQDESIADAASQLGWSAMWLELAIDRVQTKIVRPVDPTFIAAFRDYEENWQEGVSTEMWRELGLADLIEGASPSPRHANSNQTSVERKWELEDSEAALVCSNFEKAIDAQFWKRKKTSLYLAGSANQCLRQATHGTSYAMVTESISQEFCVAENYSH